MILMKKILFVLLMLSIPAVFFSCRKCSSCTARIKKTNDAVYVYPDKCGSETEINDYESQAREAYPDSLYDVICIGVDRNK
jgi:hypothetical protein